MMSRRPAVTTQADIARTYRALRACGLTIVRVVTKGGAVSFETADGKEHLAETNASEPSRQIVL